MSTSGDARITFVIPIDQKRRLQSLAKEKGLDLSSFIRSKMFEAIDEKEKAA